MNAPSYYEVANGATRVVLDGRTLFTEPHETFILDNGDFATAVACGWDAEGFEWSVQAWVPTQQRVLTEEARYESPMLEEGLFYLSKCVADPCGPASVGTLLYQGSGAEPADSIEVVVHPSDLDAGQLHMQVRMEDNGHLLEAELDLTWEVP